MQSPPQAFQREGLGDSLEQKQKCIIQHNTRSQSQSASGPEPTELLSHFSFVSSLLRGRCSEPYVLRYSRTQRRPVAPFSLLSSIPLHTSSPLSANSLPFPNASPCLTASPSPYR